MDRTLATTKRRIVNLLTRVPQGVPRSGLHAITGEMPLVRQALAELLDEGTVTERLITTVRGKPRREYVLTALLGALDHQEESLEGPPPGAKDLVAYIVTNHPGASRSDLWARSVLTKNWLGAALAELVREGRIVEIMEEDRRGGLVRRYAPVTGKERAESIAS